MFYFTCNESKIYESFTFWNNLQENNLQDCVHWIYLIHEFHNLSWISEINELFHDILIYWDAPVYRPITIIIPRLLIPVDVLFFIDLGAKTINSMWH